MSFIQKIKMDINEAIALALKEQKSGNLIMAESIYRKILEIQPDNVNALHFLGLIYFENKDFDSAIEYISKSLNIEPAYPEALLNMGLVLMAKGHFDEALYYLRKSFQFNPECAETLKNIGAILQVQGNYDEAIINYKKALEINPELSDIYKNVAYLFRDKGMLNEAIIFFKKALEYYPGIADIHNNLGLALNDIGEIDEAIGYLRNAIKINPGNPEFYNNLGVILRGKGLFDEAIGCFTQALMLNNRFLEAYNNIAVSLREKGHIEEAIYFLRKALDINPDFASAHWNLALIFLLTGNYSEGWKEYKWFWKLKDTNNFNFSKPLWDGFNIDGKTLLVYAEQGYGDTIQFSRYIPFITEAGAEVILLCQEELKELFSNLRNLKQVITFGENLPHFDFYCSILMLPAIFQTTIENIPANVPYIFTEQSLINEWRKRLNNNNSTFKIGLVWSSGHRNSTLQFRSSSLESFSMLSSIKGVEFYSLQKGISNEEVINFHQKMKIHDFTNNIFNFNDTAALIMNLDLIISVDTSVAHLAGALGKPVWVLLPSVPDWRWMLNREDSPWYPSMRLFRQTKHGDWDTVIKNVRDAILDFIQIKS